MKPGIIIYSADSETVWNAFHFANFGLKSGDTVKVFLLVKGVEVESLDTEKFVVTDHMEQFVGNGGKIYAGGTCLKSRNSGGSEMCSLSTMKEMHDIVRENDRVVTF